MSKIDELIKHYCPDGVELKKLGNLGELIRGNGLQKKDFTETGMGAVHYGQIYTYYGTFADTAKSFVSVELAKKLKKAQKGDVLITGVSENVHDVCKPLGWLGNEVCISGDMFAFRHHQNVKFITYLLQTIDFQKYKARNAQGAKVIRVKADKILEYKVPVPPLEIQAAIVDKLDLFEELEAELTTELELRRKQYDYYLNRLMSFDKKVRWASFGEVAVLKNGSDWKKLEAGKIPVYGTGGIMARVNRSAYNKPTVLIPRKGSITNIFYTEEPFWNVDTIYYTEVSSKVIPKFLYYYMKTVDLARLDMGSGRPSLTQAILNKIKVPVPPLTEQSRIVSVLDKFDMLVHDTSEGLPAEITARRKQHEFYRNRLLSFQELVV